MAKENTKTLKELIESGTFEEVHNKLFHLGQDIIKQSGHKILPAFLEKFKDYEQREKFINTLINKIAYFEMKGQSKVTDFTPLKALCLKTLGNDTLDNKKAAESKDIKFLRHETALKSMESASKLYQNLLEAENPGENKDSYLQNEQEIQTLITEMVINYGDLEEGIRLAKLSSEQREGHFGVNHPNSLQTLLLLSELGTKSKVYETQIKCVNDAELAYNTICGNTISEKNAEQIKTLLNHMSTLYSIFGDKGKADELAKEALYIEKKFQSTQTTIVAVEANTTLAADIGEKTLILKKGFTDIATLKVKSLIQEKVLNPIQQAAAKAKWHEEWGFSKLTTEYGIAGYVEKTYLEKILGTECTDANYKIALGLCFEAINIGIQSTAGKNPLAAAIFGIKYPDIIKEILNNHPEYFVDGHILKTSLLNASNYSKELLGEENVTVNSNYNKFFEAAIIPLVTERIESKVLTPLKELVVNNKLAEADKTASIKELLSNTLVDTLGNNFAQIPDIVSIARILAFKTIAKTITEKKITNLTPIEIFVKEFPDLNTRIMEDHKEYYAGNSFISKSCNNLATQHLGKVNVGEMDLFSSVISPQKPVEEEPKLLGDGHKADGEHNDVS